MTLGIWQRSEAAPGTTGDGRRGRGRRSAFWIAVAVVVLALVGTAVTVGVGRAAHRGVSLDPDNPGREGAQALAQVLDGQGVAVRVVRGQGQLLDGPRPGRGTTVVVTSMASLSAQTAATMLDRVRGADRVVLVEPDQFVLESLGLPVVASGSASPAAGVRARCVLDGLAAADTITPGGHTYVANDPAATACFEFDGAAQLVALPQGPRQPQLVVLGAGQTLANSTITRIDNAGVAVRLLARGDSVVWYVPSPLDITTEDSTVSDQVPRAIGPLVALGLLGLLVLMVWRGRRFGPLVKEPLPAVVKAIETTQARGRLYRRARDTARAGESLRTRECRRIGGYLGLPASATPLAVGHAAATATGRDPARVIPLLAGPPVQTEDALLALAHDLTELEKEVRRA